jgi:uncharacterized protein with HEPN domain
LLKRGIERNLEIIGEAIKRISKENSEIIIEKGKTNYRIKKPNNSFL